MHIYVIFESDQEARGELWRVFCKHAFSFFVLHTHSAPSPPQRGANPRRRLGTRPSAAAAASYPPLPAFPSSLSASQYRTSLSLRSALVFRPSAALRLRLRLKLSPAPYDVFLEVGQALVVLIPLPVVLPVRPPNAPRAVEVLTTRLDWLRCLGQTRPDLARSCAQASKARSVIKPFAADPERQSRDRLSSGGQVQP